MTSTIDLAVRLTQLPDALNTARRALLDATDKRTETDAAVRRHKVRIAQDVASAKGDDGKARYSNETARAAEVDSRMDTDVDAYNAAQAYREAVHAAKLAELDVLALDDQFSAARALARLGSRHDD